ncbi:MAG: RNA polymerase sigma factor [Myxococcaceae bacterium]|nr:RNA polymerase sigma factor [Myxococcaceae bacterium]
MTTSVSPTLPADPRRARAPQGDLTVLKRVYEEHGPWIRATLARLAGPGIDPDDLLHEVFLVALRRTDVFVDNPEPRAWLYGVAVRVAQAARRRARVRRFFGLESAEDIADALTPEHAVHASDAKRRVYAALNPLSEKKRTVFILFELEGLSGEEIAQIVGCPLKTVWTRLHHARREFQRNLQRGAGHAA